MRIGAAVVISGHGEDAPFTATIDGMDKVRSEPGGEVLDRLTVTRHDSGIREYVVVREGVSVVETADSIGQDQPAPPPEMEGLAHLAPPPGAPPAPMPPRVAELDAFPAESSAPAAPPMTGMAPMPGSTVGGMTLPTVSSTVPSGAHTHHPHQMEQSQSVDANPDPRYMAKPKSGTSTVYHTVEDCPRSAGLKRLPIGDAEIEFHDLTLCTSCAKLAEQISWRELIEKILGDWDTGYQPSYIVAQIAEAFEAYGFTVKPDRVDRPESA